VHTTSEEKSDDGKDSIYEKLENITDQFQRSTLKILLGNFNASVGRVGIFKPAVRNKSLH
jgi:hypothetical protein